MKCDEVIASEDEDDEDDDEEIQHLKQEIERRRIEKKQEKLRLQPAFSDGKSTSKSSSVSALSTVSSPSSESFDILCTINNLPLSDTKQVSGANWVPA